MVFGWLSCVFKVEEMSQEADGSSCWEECAADNDGAQEAAATDQGDQGDHWITVSHRRRRQTSTQEDAQVRSDDHWRPGPLSSPRYARKGRKCDHTRCQEIIDDHTYRIWPTYCSECLEVWIHENPEKFSTFTKYFVVYTMNLSV